MKIIIQRVKKSYVIINNDEKREISKGFNILAGVCDTDTLQDAEILANKVLGVRIFSDDSDKMNFSITDVAGEMLVISNFTLYADCKKRRPSFSKAGRPEMALEIFNHFVDQLKKSGLKVLTGEFGADMEVSIINDGPVTVIIES